MFLLSCARVRAHTSCQTSAHKKTCSTHQCSFQNCFCTYVTGSGKSGLKSPMIKQQKLAEMPFRLKIFNFRFLAFIIKQDVVLHGKCIYITIFHHWLMALPITSCGLCIDNEGVRVAVGLRLGLDLCSPHMCQCGDAVSSDGHHGLVCR